MKTKDFIINFFEIAGEVLRDVGNFIAYSQISYKSRKAGMFDPDKNYYGFKNLERRKIISKIDEDHFKFTPKGMKWLENSRFKYLKIKNKKWDKQWRIVIFDIPQELTKNRNIFRRRLRYLGFYMLQKSVFVYPYTCEEELGFICQNLAIGDYVDIIIADSVGFKEKEIRKYFGIK